MQNRQFVDSITNTKAATVLCTLGLRLARPGVWITYDREHPKSSGGTAHFLFESSQNNEVKRYLAIYEAGTAEMALDIFLDGLKGQSREMDGIVVTLERLIAEALIVYGRRFLDNYNVVTRSLKDDIAKMVITGGTPVFGPDGKIAGIENFTVSTIPKDQL
jgi:hypothetical protein